MKDVFLSYSSRDARAASALRDALVAHDIAVWHDADGIVELDGISGTLTAAIEETRFTVVLASTAQLASMACRWELLCSLMVGDRRGQDRLLLVSLDGSLASLSTSARARRAIPFDGSAESADMVAGKIRELLAATPSDGAGTSRGPGPLRGLPGLAGNRFVGRLDAVLQIHDALAGSLRQLDAGSVHHQPVCVVHGMGGMGKSTLGLFYAEQFGPSYAAGALWLDAGGDSVDNQAATVEDRATVCRSLTASAWAWCSERSVVPLDELGLPVDPVGRWDAMRERLGTWLSPEEDLLLVVDDVPAGLRLSELIPHASNVSVLVTSRDRLVGAQGFPAIELLPLESAAGLGLLTAAVDPEARLRRQGLDPWRGDAHLAELLVDRVGGHPLAIDLLAMRLAAGEPIAELIADVECAADDFIDVPEFLAQLPTSHKPSILATVASSLRGLAKLPLPSAVGLVRLISVLPAGAVTPLALARDVLGDSARRARDLLVQRSIATLDGADLRCHSLTRSVARRLWQDAAGPFSAQPHLEPGLSLAAADWLHRESEGLVSVDIRESARLARTCLAVQDEVAQTWGTKQRVQRSEAFLALARELYRGGARTPEDCDTAMNWVGQAQRALRPDDGDWELMGWWNAEAFRGLVLAESFSRDVRRDVTQDQRLETELVALEICRVANDQRQRIAERLLSAGVTEPSEQWIRDKLARSMFNIPGRRLQVAKALVEREPVDWSEVEKQLTLMDAEHQEVIALRRQVSPVQWADIAASIAGRGSAAYHRAVLCRLTAEEKRGWLIEGLGLLLESLRVRRDDAGSRTEVDVAKSLALIAKIAFALRALGRALPNAYAEAVSVADSARAAVAALPGDAYASGPVRPDAQNEVQRFRDARSEAMDAWIESGDLVSMANGSAVLGLIRVSLDWLSLATRGSKTGPGDPVSEFFGSPERPSEAHLMLRSTIPALSE